MSHHHWLHRNSQFVIRNSQSTAMPTFSASDNLAVNPASSKFTGTPWRARLVGVGLCISDLLAGITAFAIGITLYNSSVFEGIRLRTHVEPTHFMMMGLGISIFLVMVLSAQGLYGRGGSILNVEEDLMLLKGLIVNAAVAMGVSFLLRDMAIPRIAILTSLLVMVPLIIIGRRFIRRISAWFLTAGVGTQPVAVYGMGEVGRNLATRIMQNPQMGLRPIGFFYDEDNGEMPGEIAFGPGNNYQLPVLGSLEQLRMLQQGEVELLFVAIPEISTGRLMQIQDTCRCLRIGCHYVPLFSTSHFRRMNLTFMGDIPLLSERIVRVPFFYRITKRAFDLCLSIILFIILLPLLAIIAILIKLSSKGPVIFTQERIGLGGEPFFIYKFRTMHTEMPPYAAKPSAGDPRIFPLGRLLRRSSLDELPQLWNVIRGEMSLVGPRPDMPQIVAEYSPTQRERLLVPPGMTGLWQVSADRKFPIHENIDYDLYYIYNHSFLLDLVILVRTAFCMGGGH